MQNLVRLSQAGSISSRKANLYFTPISNGLFNHVSSSSSTPDKTLIDPSPSRSCLSQYLSKLSLCATRNHSSSSSFTDPPPPPPTNTLDDAAAAYHPPRRVMDIVSSFTGPPPPPMNTLDAAAAAYPPPRRVMDIVSRFRGPPPPPMNTLDAAAAAAAYPPPRRVMDFVSRFTGPPPPPSMNTLDAAAAAYQPPRRVMDFVRELGDDGNNVNSSSARYGINQNADIVHIKLVRNNTIVTLTDYKGDNKFWLTAGCVKEPGVGKKKRHEATARQAGRMVRDRGVKSVVLKVNGNAWFTRKKKTILAFREGYNESGLGPDRNPIVFLEDTTRLAHNGCRLRKKPRK